MGSRWRSSSVRNSVDIFFIFFFYPHSINETIHRKSISFRRRAKQKRESPFRSHSGMVHLWDNKHNTWMRMKWWLVGTREMFFNLVFFLCLSFLFLPHVQEIFINKFWSLSIFRHTICLILSYIDSSTVDVMNFLLIYFDLYWTLNNF